LLFPVVPDTLLGVKTDYDRARTAVRRALAARNWNPADLARAADVDEGTVLDFINGVRTPQLKTRGKLEAALDWPAGTLDDVASGDLEVSDLATGKPMLSVVPGTVDALPVDIEEDNEVLAAVRRDPLLDEDARAHYLNQYELLVEMSARRRAAKDGDGTERLPYVAHGRQETPVDPDEEKQLEDIAKAARRRNKPQVPPE